MTKNIPALTAGTITAMVAAVLTLLQTFGVPITKAQQDSISGVVAILAPLAVALIAAHVSTANSKVVEHENGGVIIAGKANDRVAEGTPVRHVDTINPPATIGDDKVVEASTTPVTDESNVDSSVTPVDDNVLTVKKAMAAGLVKLESPEIKG